jgi:hypothetical protein
MTAAPELPLPLPEPSGHADTKAVDNTDNKMPTIVADAIAKCLERRLASAADSDLAWWEQNPDLVIVEEQLRTAVFINRAGKIAIRQARPFDDDDAFVFIRPEHAPALIRRLQQLIG